MLTMRYVIPLSLLLACACTASVAAAVNTAAIDKAVQEGKLSEAGKMWEELAVKNPTRADVQLGYARFLQSVGQTDPAIKEFQRSLSLSPQQPEAYVGLAEISMQILDVQSALTYSQKALALDKRSKNARMIEVNALMQSGRNAQADDELAPLLSEPTRDAEVLHLAYEVKARKGDLSNASNYLQQAVKLAGDRVDWMIDLGTLLESSGDYRTARAYYQEAIERDPKSVDARLHLARNLEVFEKDYDGAIAEYQSALQISSDSPTALSGIDRCQAKKNDLARRFKLSLQQLFGRH